MNKRSEVVKELGYVLRYCHEHYNKVDDAGQCELARINEAAKNAIELLQADKPKAMLMEVPFYRGLVLDHMETAGFNIAWSADRDLHNEQAVHKETVEIMNTRNQIGWKLKKAFYIGQLSLLDYINKLQSTYTAVAEND